jgi:glycosyltransferase involved in cell wall biosynthesis
LKRVLHLIKGLGRGGAEQLLLHAAPYLDRTRFDYEIAYLLPWKDALVEPLRAAGVPAHCLDGARGIGWVPRLRALVKDRRFDIVHSHSPLPAALARIALPRSVQQVYTEHGVWEHHHLGTRLLNGVTYWRNDHVFAVSRQVLDSIKVPRPFSMLPMPVAETLHHGVDLDALDRVEAAYDSVREELGIAVDAPIVGTVANFRRLKGHHLLLQAALSVRRSFPEARFVLVGRGPIEQEIRRATQDLGLNGSIVFAGFRIDAPRVMSAFDVFVLPSIHEGLPIALVEAMALGRPVVATRVGGLPEVVRDGTEGFLVPSGDPVALADAIVTILGSHSLREQMGRAGRRRAKEFDIERPVHRIETVYEELT